MKPEVLLQLIHDLQAQIGQLRQANSVLQQQLAVAQDKATQITPLPPTSAGSTLRGPGGHEGVAVNGSY